MASKGKGSKVELSTFLSWGKESIIGYKTENVDNRVFVNFAWCKICERNKNAIFVHPNCKGPVKKSVLAYIEGTNYVSKHNVHRHLEGEGHRIVLQIERAKPTADRINVLMESTSASTSAKVSYIVHKCMIVCCRFC